MTSIADAPLTALSFCWRLERTDGAGLALTSGDRDLLLGGVLYRSAPGVTPAAITRSLGLEPDSGEVAGALSAECLSEDDLAKGRWDGASATLFAADWTSPGGETIPMLAGQIGDVSIDGDGFTAELKGAASRLNAAPCPSTSPECRASFGDRRCRVDLAGRSIRASVASADGNVVDIGIAAEDRFLFGRLRYLSGANCGLSSAIIAVNATLVSVRDKPAAPVEPGTVIELREGCDKRFETCVSRFAKGVNFRGEPHLPGTDLLTRYPGA